VREKLKVVRLNYQPTLGPRVTDSASASLLARSTLEHLSPGIVTESEVLCQTSDTLLSRGQTTQANFAKHGRTEEGQNQRKQQ